MEQLPAFRSAPVLPFVVIPIVLVFLFVWGVHAAWRRSGASKARARRAAVASTIGSVAWMAITWVLAANGTFADFDATPPPFGLMVFAVVAIACAIAFGRVGERLAATIPLWLLVAVQSFRLPLEIAMHGMYEAGVMPIEMSYSGRNFDIVTGATAIPVAALVWWGIGGRKLVAAWNIVGLVLLVNIVTVAVLATPRFQYFGRDHLNVWVMHPPFVWLPAVMVLAALAGHLVVYRVLRKKGG
jgi:hypothetical protein